ncbi:MAG: hypothetical protein EHM41_00870 [Chloroflexi bacterium]|nr:MAG: hypothetical protein EHM41_00870 [Chloroflexota bacterium]
MTEGIPDTPYLCAYINTRYADDAQTQPKPEPTVPKENPHECGRLYSIDDYSAPFETYARKIFDNVLNCYLPSDEPPCPRDIAIAQQAFFRILEERGLVIGQKKFHTTV